MYSFSNKKHLIPECLIVISKHTPTANYKELLKKVLNVKEQLF